MSLDPGKGSRSGRVLTSKAFPVTPWEVSLCGSRQTSLSVAHFHNSSKLCHSFALVTFVKDKSSLPYLRLRNPIISRACTWRPEGKGKRKEHWKCTENCRCDLCINFILNNSWLGRLFLLFL